MEKMYAALRVCTCVEKTTFLGKDDLSIVELGGGEIAFRRVYLARAYTTLVVLVLKSKRSSWSG